MKQNRKLKIAIISDAIYPYNKGGKEKRIYEISTRLAKSGHDVHLYTMHWWKGKEENRIENGVHLHAISKLYPLYSGKRRSFGEALFFSLAGFKLIKEDFDILEVDHMPHLVLFSTKIVALLKGKKLYATWNEVWGRKYWNEYLGSLGTIAYLIEWLSVRMPDKIIAVSEHTKKKLQDDLQVRQEIFVAPNGIDLKMIQKVKPAKEKSDVIFAGRLLENKHVDVLVKSIALVKKDYPQIKAFIIGNGPEKHTLEQLIKTLQLEDNVKLLGFLEKHTNLYALFKSSKVFVFPSTREGFGIAALEANACGLPVITTNDKDNATKYLIANGGNGYITRLDAHEIAEKIRAVLASKMSGNKHNDIEKYDWSTITKEVEEVYNK